MTGTALRASAQSANNIHMVFMDEEHERLEIEGVLMTDGKDRTAPSTSDKAHASIEEIQKIIDKNLSHIYNKTY